MLTIILNGLGAVASILGLLWVLTHETPKKLVVSLLIVIAVLTTITSYLTYENEKIYSAEAQKQREIDEVKRLKNIASKEAKVLLDKYPEYFDRYNPGRNKGLMLAGVAYLEKYRQLNIETFNLVQKTVIQDITHITNKAGDLNDHDLGVLRDSARSIKEVISSFVLESNENS